MDISVSVCFASRGRPAALRDSVHSLLDRAVCPQRVQILVALDPDDASRTAINDWIIGYPQVSFWPAPERFGYTRLHDYLNPLAAMAGGKWVLWWNDDMRMRTYGWDDTIAGSRPAVLWPHANHVTHANIAPAWPRAWSQATGRASPTSHMDTYWQRVGEALGRHDRAPIWLRHERADVTGGHDDATYAEGRALLGAEGMVPGFDPAALDADVARDVAIIRGLL